MSKSLSKLMAKSKRLENEIAEKSEAIKKLNEEIGKLQMEQLADFLTSTEIPFDEKFYEMTLLGKKLHDIGIETDKSDDTVLLIKQIHDKGIKLNDVRKMLGIEVSTSSQIETKLKLDTSSAAETTATEENNEK